MAQPAPIIEEESNDFPLDGEATAEKSKLDIEAALTGTIGKLQLLADKQVQMKAAIEQRWLDDLRQFHGRYETTTELALKDSKKSKLFVNLTRSKTNSWEARLSDLLFPTDDKNWGIKPTPAPHLAEAAKQAVAAAKDAADKATQAHQQGQPEQGAQIAQAGNDAALHGASIQDEIEEAQKRAGLMDAEIETQLRTSDYNIRSRDVIRDMVRMGAGIMKGPVTSQKLRRSWVKVASTPVAPPANDVGGLPMPGAAGTPYDPSQGAGSPSATTLVNPAQNVDPNTAGTCYQLDLSADPAPEFQWIDPWSYFPDMSARNPEEAEFHFERHLWNAKMVRAAVKRLGLDPVATADLLREVPRDSVPNYWGQLQQITANTQMVGIEKRFQVWEFQGVLEDEDLQAIAAATGDETAIKFVADNPLLEVPVVLWFCQGRLLKFAPFPLDSGESLYSVVPFEPDDTSMFGFGVPYLMRDSQAAINGGWRMMMDNGGLAVGPQIVIDGDAVKPQDGNWNIVPMKVWLKASTSLTTKMPDGYKPFETFAIGANQAPLQNIITMARQFADDETNMPLIAQGDMGSHISKTSGGMSMLMNSANVVFRRVVKNFDDCQTTPNIRRIYDWNMQFSKRDDIKGDFNIDARGSSVLLVKEMQSQTLMQALTVLAPNPITGPMIKVAPLLRKLFQTQMIHADDAVKSDEVIEQEAQVRAQQAAQQPQDGTDPAKLASEEKIAKENNDTKLQVAQINQKTALIELAGKMNLSMEQLKAELQMSEENIAHKERVFAAEAALPKDTKNIGGTEFGGSA